LGVVTSVRLRVVPAFVLAAVEAPMRLDSVLSGLDELVSSNDHFEFFWIPHTGWAITKRNNRTSEPAVPMPRIREWWQKSFLENTAFGAVCRVGRTAPALIPRLATALPSSGQVTYSNASHKVFASPRRVRFVEMEYAIPREACVSAVESVRRMIEGRGFRVSFPVEVRFTSSDDLLLSTAHGRETAYIAVHMYKGTPFEDYFRSVEAIMRDHGGRPHWGKMHFLGASDLSPLYPRWDAFQCVRSALDPDGVFVNDYVRRIFGLPD
jgi:FAD/FMN-containing dehydrogenase